MNLKTLLAKIPAPIIHLLESASYAALAVLFTGAASLLPQLHFSNPEVDGILGALVPTVVILLNKLAQNLPKAQ